MIRKITTGVIIVFCFATLPSMAKAQTAFTIGGNYWYAKRDLSGDYWEGVKSKDGNMIGPYASLRVGKCLLGSSMFFGTFSEYNINKEPDGTTLSYNNKRSDLNFSLGYAILSHVNVFAALKHLSLNDEDNQFSYFTGGSNKWYGKRKIVEKGTMVGGGASGVFRFSKSPFFIHCSAAYLKGVRNTSDKVYVEGKSIDSWGGDFKTDNSIIALSGGLGIQTDAGISILVGYRADIFDFKTKDTDMSGKENIGGITVTLAYTLR